VDYVLVSISFAKTSEQENIFWNSWSAMPWLGR